MTNKMDKARILIAEDEALIAADLERRLITLGYTVGGKAATSEKALKYLEHQKTDLVVIDIGLQGDMDGIETARVIKDRWNIPVVFITALSDLDILGQAKLTYPFGYLIKPFEVKALKVTIEMALNTASVDRERRLAEEALKESEKQKSLILNSTNEMFAYYDLELRIQWCNEACGKSVGKNTEELIGKYCYEVWHQRDEPCENCPIVRVLETGRPQEDQITTPDGRIWHLRGYPVFDDSGTLIGLTEFGENITEKRQAEENLRRSEALLNATQRLTKIGGWEWDVKNRTMFWSEEVYRLHGYKPDMLEFASEEHIAKSLECYRPEDRPIISAAFDKCAKEGIPYDLEFLFTSAKGRRMWIRTTAQPVFEEGTVAKVIGNIMDITDREQAEEALRVSEERFKLAIEGTLDGLWDWDLLTDEKYHSDRFAAMLGYQPEELPRSTEGLYDLVHPDDRESVIQTVKDYLKQKKDRFEFTFRVRTKDGDDRWITARGRFLYDDDGTPVRFVGFNSDITERKEADVKLNRSEATLRAIMEALPIGINLVEGRKWLTSNRAMVEILGYSLEEQKGLPLRNLYQSDAEFARVGEILYSGQKGENLRHVETTWVRKDGTQVDIWLRVMPLDFEGCEEDTIVGIAEDITERKRTDAELYQRAQIMAQVHDSIVITDLESRITDINLGAQRLHGYTREEVLGRSISILVPRRHQARLMDIIKKELPNFEQYSIEIPMLKREGDLFYSHLSLSLLKDRQGKPVGTVGYFLDITDRRQAELALRDRQVELEQILGALPDALIYADVERRIMRVNPSFVRMFGYESKEVVGKTPEFLYSRAEDFVEQGRRFYHGSIHDLKTPIMIELRRKNGEVFPGETIGTKVCDARDQTIGVIALIRDVTEAKRAEEEKERLQAQLQQAQKMEAVGTLAGGIAHDFNNLLQAISGYAQLIILDTDKESPMLHNVNGIISAGQRAKELIRQLLLFSRRVEATRRPVKLNRVIEHARNMLERTIPKMIDIELHLDRRLWTVRADPVQMEQILLNLGQNAADAMPDGGKLRIETSNAILDETYVESNVGSATGNFVLLTVSDTGHGMERETLEHIFEPFFTTKEVGKGTGLGLASAYGIVISHGGWINCYSEVGRGTTFKIYLPAIEQVDVNEGKDKGVMQPQGGTETILVVDDEAPILDFALKVLKRFGYNVVTASSAEEALEIYTGKGKEIDLVILDIGMPGMGGHKCLGELLQMNPSVKVIVASGYSIGGRVKKTLEAGALAYIAKPYQISEMLEKVRAVLDATEPAGA